MLCLLLAASSFSLSSSSSVLDLVNGRFASGSSNSTSLSTAGVVIHQFDNWCEDEISTCTSLCTIRTFIRFRFRLPSAEGCRVRILPWQERSQQPVDAVPHDHVVRQL
jgi:hypothetical protein